MKIQIACQHTSLTPALEQHVAQALEKISSHTDKPVSAHVVLSISSAKPGPAQHTADATVTIDGKAFHAGATSQDMYQSIDTMSKNLDRIVRKDKTARLSRRDAPALKMA